MIGKRTLGCWGWKVCLIAVLCGCGLACHPASSGTGTGPASTKPEKLPEKKDQPDKQPKPDVGKASQYHPFGAPPVRAMSIGGSVMLSP